MLLFLFKSDCSFKNTNPFKPLIMKKTLHISALAKFFFAMLFIAYSFQSSAQWVNWGTYTATNSGMGAVGVGAFGVPNPAPQSRLHVSNFYCFQPTSSLNGFLFRTDGLRSVQNKWQIFTGNGTAGSSPTEKFRLFIPANTSNVILNATQPSGNMRFQTNGISRIHIQNGTGTTAGFVGINTNSPLNTLTINSNTFSPQPAGLRFTNLTSTAIPVANPGTGVLSVNPAGDVIYVNGGGTGANLCGGIPIDNVVKFVGASTLCTTNITDLAGGFVGINNTAPNDALDVTGLGGNGNIDVTDITKAYKIFDQPFLWHKGDTTDIFGGVWAGANATGSFNAFYGYHAGAAGGGSGFNTFIGAEAGFQDTSGDENVFVGWRSGYSCAQGVHNTFVGNVSGSFNYGGSNNTFIGIGSGNANVNGSGNTGLGAGSGPSTPNLNNVAAVGAGAIVTQNDKFILANNTQNVGIGLSSNPIGPNNKLEINTTAGSPYFGSINGSSGLRFRNMTSANTPGVNPGSGLLAVDANGDVIYVNGGGGGGGGFGNYCGATPNPLTGNYTVPLNYNNFYFSEDSTDKDKVMIGYPCNVPGRAKLDVFTYHNTVIGNIQSIAISGITSYNNVNSQNTGVYGEAFATAAGTTAIGVQGMAAGDVDARGVYGQVGAVPAGPAYGGYFESLALFNQNNFGLLAEAANATANNYGVHSTATGGSSAVGGEFNGIDGTVGNVGIQINSITNVNSGSNFGVNTSSFNSAVLSQSNIGVIGFANNTGTVMNNIGVAGRAANSGTIINTSTTALIPNNIGLYGEGNIAAYLAGPMVTGGVLVFSDQKIKSNIKTMESAMELIKKLRPVTYDFNTSKYPELYLSKEPQFGFIAQEVRAIIPGMVQDVIKPEFQDKEGNINSKGGAYSALNYIELIPVLTKAIQEQQATIEKQQQQLDELKSLLTGTYGSIQPKNNVLDPSQLDVRLGNEDIIVLNQNIPNPFAEKTTITYSLPSSVTSAQLIFYSNSGQMIKTVEIANRGKGQLNVFAGDLSNGNYSYALVVDGKVIESKKMVKQD